VREREDGRGGERGIEREKKRKKERERERKRGREEERERVCVFVHACEGANEWICT